MLAPGISVFGGGLEYAHGGLTLQETLTLRLTISRSGQSNKANAKIISARWIGLRLKLEIESEEDPTTLDAQVRKNVTESKDAPTTLKQLDEDGIVSLVVPDDTLEGRMAFVVLLSGNEVIAKQPTTIGEN